jgi:hypothetical protein
VLDHGQGHHRVEPLGGVERAEAEEGVVRPVAARLVEDLVVEVDSHVVAGRHVLRKVALGAPDVEHPPGEVRTAHGDAPVAQIGREHSAVLGLGFHCRPLVSPGAPSATVGSPGNTAGRQHQQLGRCRPRGVGR